MENRNSDGRFKRGASGNPTGRPRLGKDVLLLARSKTSDAIRRLAELVDDDDPRVALKACEVLLDRAWGRPPQFLDLNTRNQGGDQARVEYVITSEDPKRDWRALETARSEDAG